MLRKGAEDVSIGSIDATARCDLGLIDDLLHLRVAAARLGWSVHLRDPDRDVRELVELVGVTDWLS